MLNWYLLCIHFLIYKGNWVDTQSDSFHSEWILHNVTMVSYWYRKNKVFFSILNIPQFCQCKNNITEYYTLTIAKIVEYSKWKVVKKTGSLVTTSFLFSIFHCFSVTWEVSPSKVAEIAHTVAPHPLYYVFWEESWL